MAPMWLTVVAWLYLSVCFGCAALIAYDIFVSGHRQPMGVMNAVFPITALYFRPAGAGVLLAVGRTATGTGHGAGMGHPASDRGERPWWVMMATEVSHCGSGCVLGDVISEFIIFGLALTVAGARVTQPCWAPQRPSWHEDGVLRYGGCGGQHFDLGWLRRPVWFPPGCDGPAHPSGRPRNAESPPKRASAERNRGRPEHGGQAVHYHGGQERPVPVVLATWRLPTDRTQPRGDGR